MEIVKTLLIENIPHRPYAYEFIEHEYILIHAHSFMYLYDLNGKLVITFDTHSNGFRGLLKKVTDQYFTFGNTVLDSTLNKTNKRFKSSKKSVEKYGFTYGPKYIKEQDLIIAGFQKGIIGFYDKALKVIKHIELNKDEYLVELFEDSETAYTYSEKRGLIIEYHFPDFTFKNEYKIGKQNRSNIITKDYIFNYGYTSTNYLYNSAIKEVQKIQFHPTNKKGYKEQYSGAHNFGVSWIKQNQENINEVLVCTDQSKCLVFNMSTKDMLELKAYEKLGFDRFKGAHPDQHPYRGFFKDNYIYTNFGSKFILWDKNGNALLITDNVDDINIDSTNQAYSLTNGNLYKIELKL